MTQRSVIRIVMAASLLAGAPLAASAQDKPITWNVGGGATLPMSDSGDRFETGFNFVGGLRFNATETFGIQAEYGFNGHGVKSNLLNVSSFDASHQMQYIDLNLVFHTKEGDGASFYGVLGGGYYYRKVEITQFVGNAVVPYCDPWLYFCYSTVVPVEQILGSRSNWKPGFDVGVGIAFKQFYLESRYHYITGDEFTLPNGSTVKNSGQYLPLTIGFRF